MNNNHNELKTRIEQAWDNRELLHDESYRQTVREVIDLVDRGELRTAQPVAEGSEEWQVNEWVKKAVLLYFPIQPMRKMQAGELEWFDKMELKHDYERLGVRVVPHAVARYGAYIAYKGKNYRIPRGTKPEELTLEECMKIVSNSKK